MKTFWPLGIIAFGLLAGPVVPAQANPPTGYLHVVDDDDDGPPTPPDKPWHNLVLPGALIVVGGIGLAVNSRNKKRSRN